jgi:hypothetical protein
MIIEEIIKAVLSGQRVATLDPYSLGADQLTGFVEFGSALPTSIYTLTKDEVERRFSELRRWTQHVSGDNKLNAVYLDTTTLHTVRSLILDEDDPSMYLVPATLLDLNNFINCVILFDHIFFLENSHIDPYELNEALGNEPVLISLPVESFGHSNDKDPLNSVEALLRGMWYETDRYIQELKDVRRSDPLYDDSQEIKRAWKSIIEFSEDDRLWFDPERSVKNGQFHTDGPLLLNDLLKVYSHTGRDAVYNHINETCEQDHLTRYVHSVIDECNYRSLFNLQVSNGLQLFYIPNSFRLPFRNYFYRKARVIQSYVPSIRAIEKEYGRFAELYSAGDQNNLHLPLFLAAVLNQISGLDQFFEVLAEVRKKASTFRAHRAELDAALEKGSIKESKRLLKALQEDGEQLRLKFPVAPVAGGIAAVLSAFTGGLSHFALATIGILAAGSQFSPYYERLKERALRRQYWFLTDMRDTADGLTLSYPLVSKLWKLNKFKGQSRSGESFADQFARLKTLSY